MIMRMVSTVLCSVHFMYSQFKIREVTYHGVLCGSASNFAVSREPSLHRPAKKKGGRALPHLGALP